MKKTILILSVMTMAVLFSACEKEPIEVTKEITVNYHAKGLELANAGPYYFDFPLNNIVEIDLGVSDPGSNALIWRSMPLTYNNAYFYYEISGNKLYFYAKVQEGYIFTMDFSKDAKIIYRTTEY